MLFLKNLFSESTLTLHTSIPLFKWPKYSKRLASCGSMDASFLLCQRELDSCYFTSGFLAFTMWHHMGQGRLCQANQGLRAHPYLLAPGEPIQPQTPQA